MEKTISWKDWAGYNAIRGGVLNLSLEGLRELCAMLHPELALYEESMRKLGLTEEMMLEVRDRFIAIDAYGLETVHRMLMELKEAGAFTVLEPDGPEYRPDNRGRPEMRSSDHKWNLQAQSKRGHQENAAPEPETASSCQDIPNTEP